MTRAELIRLARIGAEARLAALQNEIQAIYLSFPQLRGKGGKETVGADAPPPAKKRGASNMSAAARRSISLAQKKRWAEWRKKKAKGVS
jgi:hypothetical protein